MPGLIARRRQSVAFFGPFSGHGTAGPQGCEVASDAELIVKTEFTLKLVPFVEQTDARKALFCGIQPAAAALSCRERLLVVVFVDGSFFDCRHTFAYTWLRQDGINPACNSVASGGFIR